MTQQRHVDRHRQLLAFMAALRTLISELTIAGLFHSASHIGFQAWPLPHSY
jgi:hypothetical protein